MSETIAVVVVVILGGCWWTLHLYFSNITTIITTITILNSNTIWLLLLQVVPFWEQAPFLVEVALPIIAILWHLECQPVISLLV
jgi:uncharacterized membrane protein